MRYNEKLVAALVWGIAIGFLLLLIDRSVAIRAGGGIIYFMFGLPAGWLIIGAFSYFYLRSMFLGGMCGAVAGLSYSTMATVFNFNDYFSHGHLSLLLFYMIAGVVYGAAIYAVPGVIGGALSMRVRTKN